MDKLVAAWEWVKTNWKVVVGAFVVGAILGAVSAPAKAQVTNPDLIEIITVNGIIHDGTAAGLAGTVKEINKNKKIKAVLLVVDSPGGGAIASAHAYEELAKLNAPVVGFCESVCASGGEYILMAPSVKHIMVRDATISGSIGVIMQTARFNRLLNWAMIDAETYRSGNLKDAGNPTRSIEEAEKKYLEGIVNDLAENFYAVVGKSRKIKDWNAIKSARIFIGKQAVDVGLADSVGNKDAAIKKAKELSGSKLIFTRDELREMSKVAEATSSSHDMHSSVPAPMLSPYGDVAWVIETLKEIRGGSSVRIEYRMPYRF